jgi:hypothetical protein
MNTPTTQERHPFGAATVGFLIGVPLAWSLLLWFHPSVAPDDVYGSLRDRLSRTRSSTSARSSSSA